MTKQDTLRRFLFEELGIRGELVQLNTCWQEAKQHQSLTPRYQEVLGHALASVVMLSATIKFEGAIILQVQGNGQVKTLVAQATHDRKIRGLIRQHSDNSENPNSLFGEGQLIITIAPTVGEAYQGVVSINNDQLNTALENYFIHSEQLNTRLWLFADGTHAAGLLLQEIPSKVRDQEDWARLCMLADTLTSHELFKLDAEDVLFRLFNQEKVRVFDEESVSFECSCSTQKIAKALYAMGREELEGIIEERGTIEVICEFCNAHFYFDQIDVERIVTDQELMAISPTLH
ncbi:MAG: Hsp33 family molecular chaperone HslO [Methylovulum sp.]|jgi:molecular chaperone Hsp33|nr:Hsp33 family molecular chaperone HslO [Methylovulum sp.]